jgi:hypothetical protein
VAPDTWLASCIASRTWIGASSAGWPARKSDRDGPTGAAITASVKRSLSRQPPVAPITLLPGIEPLSRLTGQARHLMRLLPRKLDHLCVPQEVGGARSGGLGSECAERTAAQGKTKCLSPKIAPAACQVGFRLADASLRLRDKEAERLVGRAGCTGRKV